MSKKLNLIFKKKKPPDKTFREDKHSFDAFNLKSKPEIVYEGYKVIKVPLKGILRNYHKNAPIFLKHVSVLNKIVTRTYQFIRLFVLDKLKNNQSIPVLNNHFCYHSLSTISNMGKTRGAMTEETIRLKVELLKFYQEHYAPLLVHPGRIQAASFSEVLQKISIEMETAYENNLQKQFLKRFSKLLFIELAKTLPRETKEEKKLFSKIRAHIYNALFFKDVNKISKEFKAYQFLYDFGLTFLPENILDEKGLAYDLKVNAPQYMDFFVKINQYYAEHDHKQFQTISLRNSVVPKHMPFNLKALLYLFPQKDFRKFNNMMKLRAAGVASEEMSNAIWSRLFKMDKKCFRAQNYRFDNRITTDGISCSIHFYKCDLNQKKIKKKLPKKDKKELDNKWKAVTVMDEAEQAKYRNKILVGLDPGTRIIAQLVSKDKKLRYTNMQKQFESFSNRNRNVRTELRRKSGAIEAELALAGTNSKSLKYGEFSNFLKIKDQVIEKVCEEYERLVYRKMKLRKFICSKKSVDSFLNKISETFDPEGDGSNIVIGYGNWSRGSAMRGLVPSMGRGFRSAVSRRFKIVMIDEFNTSKKCHGCGKELENLRNKQNKKVHRCLVCNECLSLKNNSKICRYINRDINGGLNILSVLEDLIAGKARRMYLQRVSSSDDTLHLPPDSGDNTCA